MANQKLLKKVAPVVLSAAMAMTSMPTVAMAADFSDSDVVSDAVEVEETPDAETEAEVEVDTEEVADDTADVDVVEDEDADTAETDSEENLFSSEVTEDEFSDQAGDDQTTGEAYVLMNIPYDDFYKAELKNNDVKVDAFTSATLNKSRTAGMMNGNSAYHTDVEGTNLAGVTFPVKVSDLALLKDQKKVTDDDSVTITVTNKGQTASNTYTGKDSLIENASYSYYVLSEVPGYYKELTVNEDGSFTFSDVKGAQEKTVEATAELKTQSKYGDYQLKINNETFSSLISTSTDKIYGATVNTTDGTEYGMRHLENIWRGNEIAWSTGFTSEVHGCPTSSEHYKSMMGKTIDSIEYYTTNGVYTMDIADIYVPVKSETTKAEVADADITAGKTTINVQLPDEFKPEYSVDGLDVSVEGNVLTFKAATESRAAASVKPGKYTLTIKDKNKKYADVVTTFTLTTKDMPAAYDEENKKLVEAEGFDTDALKAYLGNITSVNVNGKDYAASGRGSVVIINKDGTIKTDADPFKDAVAGTEFQITVASTGYTTPLTFTYKIAETPAPAEVDTTALEAAIAEADNLKEADYTADSWSVYQAALQSARTALEAKESQDAVDQALAALNAAKDALVKAEEEPVAINTASLEKAIADAKALKEADYTAESWKALQSALSDARKALEAKESQEAVDNATNSLNKAIKALVKKGSSSVKKTDGTTNGSKTSGSDSVKTGDPASVLGWLGLAVSSLGAGMGGFAWKRRKRK